MAVKLVYQSYKYEEIQTILDVSVGLITSWKQAYEEYGISGLRLNHKGRKSDKQGQPSTQSCGDIKMSDKTWEHWTLDNIGKGIHNGSIDPRELVEYFLAKIDQDTEKEKIFIDIFREQARQDAEASYKRALSYTRLSLYDGIPLVWKDNFDIQGKPTSAGVKILRERIAQRDATAYRTAADAGFICLGKSNMTELAFSGLGINPTFGTPRNPFDREQARVPGGSSSGSAVAVAKGLCCASIGTDTGGSIRTPAAWNNLVGLKTTAGLISTEGVIPLSQTLDTVGFITRCVEDAATLYHVIAQVNPVDLSETGCKGLNLLVCTNTVFDGIDAKVLAVIYSYIEKLAKRGVLVKTSRISEISKTVDIVNAKGNIVSYEASKNWQKFLKENPGCISQDILDRFLTEAKIRESDITELRQELGHLRHLYLEKTNSYDAILMPTVVNVPPVIAEIEQDSQNYRLENLMSLRNTRLVNLLGLCAISLPIGFTPSGLPVGIMLVAPPFSEVPLLRTALSLSRLTQPYQ